MINTQGVGELVTFADLARELGMHVKAVRRALMRGRGRLPELLVHADGRWRVDREAALRALTRE